jgi:hypothetical protein
MEGCILGEEYLRQVDQVEPLHIRQCLDRLIADLNSIGIVCRLDFGYCLATRRIGGFKTDDA